MWKQDKSKNDTNGTKFQPPDLFLTPKTSFVPHFPQLRNENNEISAMKQPEISNVNAAISEKVSSSRPRSDLPTSSVKQQKQSPVQTHLETNDIVVDGCTSAVDISPFEEPAVSNKDIDSFSSIFSFTDLQREIDELLESVGNSDVANDSKFSEEPFSSEYELSANQDTSMFKFHNFFRVPLREKYLNVIPPAKSSMYSCSRNDLRHSFNASRDNYETDISFQNINTFLPLNESVGYNGNSRGNINFMNADMPYNYESLPPYRYSQHPYASRNENVNSAMILTALRQYNFFSRSRMMSPFYAPYFNPMAHLWYNTIHENLLQREFTRNNLLWGRASPYETKRTGLEHVHRILQKYDNHLFPKPGSCVTHNNRLPICMNMVPRQLMNNFRIGGAFIPPGNIARFFNSSDVAKPYEKGDQKHMKLKENSMLSVPGNGLYLPVLSQTEHRSMLSTSGHNDVGLRSDETENNMVTSETTTRSISDETDFLHGEEIKSFLSNRLSCEYLNTDALPTSFEMKKEGRDTKYRYYCPDGSNCFTDPSTLKLHTRTHIEKHHACDSCPKKFSTNYNLSRHERTHTEKKPHVCGICKKAFSAKCSLMKHIRTHTKEKPHVCGICKMAFSQKHHVQLHMITHTKEKPHACQICKKLLSYKCSLIRHMRTHTKEKPHVCGICKKAFSAKFTLMQHMRTHTKEKPHVCGICKKAFSLKHHVQHHMLTHTKEKPHACQICKKLFSLKCNLIRHMRSHSIPLCF